MSREGRNHLKDAAKIPDESCNIGTQNAIEKFPTIIYGDVCIQGAAAPLNSAKVENSRQLCKLKS